MLEGLGLLVDLLPVHFQCLHEKGLDKPVLTQDRQRMAAPLRGQADALSGLVLKQPLGSHGFHHGRYRSRSDPKRFSDCSGGYNGILVARSDEDDLEIVFDRA